jgi:YidC/Oxa1 family membrane protein insertase
MVAIDFFEYPAALLAWLYAITHNYALAISLIAVIVMLLVTPLILKSTKGMLEMQRLGPEMRRLQAEHRDDRQKLNEEMMKLYQEHKVNPMASCLPLVAQMPVFIIMFRVLHGLTYEPAGGNKLMAQTVLDAAGDTGPVGFAPRYLSKGSELYQSLVRAEHMNAFGLDLSVSPAEMLGTDFGRGLIYAGLVVLLGALYFGQQRMVAARAAVSPTMSPAQQKLMQYLPVVFAVFQVFFLLGLVVYYIVQSILRILQQFYITKRFYAGDESLGRQAQAASERAREMAKTDGGGGPLAQAKRDLADAKKSSKSTKQRDDGPEPDVRPTKRTTPPKNRPTPSTKQPASKRPSTRPSSRPASSKRHRKS